MCVFYIRIYKQRMLKRIYKGEEGKKETYQGSFLLLLLLFLPRPPPPPPFPPPPPRMAPRESSARLALERELEPAEGALGGSSGIGEGAPAVVVAVEVDDESGGGFGAAAASSACLGGSENETADAEVALLR